MNGYECTRHIVINDTEIRGFIDSGAFFDDLDSPTTSNLYAINPIDRSLETIISLRLDFSTALTDEYKLEFLSIEQL